MNSIKFIAILLSICFTWADNLNDSIQIRKEKVLIDTLKDHMACKKMKGSDVGDLYCTILFRGLNIQIAGANRKDGGTYYNS